MDGFNNSSSSRRKGNYNNNFTKNHMKSRNTNQDRKRRRTAVAQKRNQTTDSIYNKPFKGTRGVYWSRGGRGNSSDKKFEKFVDIRHRNRERDYNQMNWPYNNIAPQNNVFFGQDNVQSLHSNDMMIRSEQPSEIMIKEVATQREEISISKETFPTPTTENVGIENIMNTTKVEAASIVNVKTEYPGLPLDVGREKLQIKVEHKGDTSSSSSSSSSSESASEKEPISKPQAKSTPAAVKSEDLKVQNKTNELKPCNKAQSEHSSSSSESSSSSSSEEEVPSSSLNKSVVSKAKGGPELKGKSQSASNKEQSEDDVVCVGNLKNQIDLDDEEESDNQIKRPAKKCKKSKKDSIHEQCMLCDKEGHTSFQCQMICKNCSAPYHGFRTCPHPPNLNTMLQLFMEFCVQQLNNFQPNPQNSLQQLQRLLDNESKTVPLPLVSTPAMYENSTNKRKSKEKTNVKEKRTVKKFKTNLKTDARHEHDSDFDTSASSSGDDDTSSDTESVVSEVASKSSRKRSKKLKNGISSLADLNFANFLSTPANYSNFLGTVPNFPNSSSSSSSNAYNSMLLQQMFQRTIGSLKKK